MDKRTEELRDLQNQVDTLKARKDEIKKRAREHRDALGEGQIDADTIEVRDITEKITAAEAKIKNLQGENGHMEDRNSLLNTSAETREARAKKFVETRKCKICADEIRASFERRSTLVSSGGIATPTIVGDSISEGALTRIPTVIDKVYVNSVDGASSEKVSYLKTLNTAAIRAPGTAASSNDNVYGLVEIKGENIATISYIDKNMQKTSPLNYLDKTERYALIALKKKIAGLIFVGTNEVKGVLNAEDSESNEMFKTQSVMSTAIDENTLNNIVFGYEGSAVGIGDMTLYLNLADLKAFGAVRGTNEKKAVYEITPDKDNMREGVIKQGGISCRYCVVDELTALSASTRGASAIKTMVFGQPLNYQLNIYGDYEITMSNDEKFSQGLIAVLGEVTVGGNIVVKNGFSVITLAANS